MTDFKAVNEPSIRQVLEALYLAQISVSEAEILINNIIATQLTEK